uniref:DUF4476 domain-containing protein n=1 Tax=Parastrongyloides trichosuri TaxID=131310 RepID=A0A0N5A1Y3_PARTI
MSSEEGLRLFGMLQSVSLGKKISLSKLREEYNSNFGGNLDNELISFRYERGDEGVIQFLKEYGNVQFSIEKGMIWVEFEMNESQNAQIKIFENSIQSKKNKEKSNRGRKGRGSYFEDRYSPTLCEIYDHSLIQSVQPSPFIYYKQIMEKQERKNVLENNIINNSTNNEIKFEDSANTLTNIVKNNVNDQTNVEEENIAPSTDSTKIVSSRNEAGIDRICKESILEVLTSYNKTPRSRKELREIIRDSMSVLNYIDDMLKSIF